MWTALLPIWARIAVIVTALGAIALVADRHRAALDDVHEQAALGAQQHAFDVRIQAADDALIAANQRAAAASQGAATDQSAITAAYTKGKNDEALASQARMAQLLAGGKRVRIDATCRPANAAGGVQLPSVTAVAGRADAAAAPDVELSPAALGRLGSAADKIVGDLRQQVIALQALAQSEHDRCNQVSTPPATPPPRTAAEEIAHKRSIFNLGSPNPFDK